MSEFRIHHDVNELLSLLHVRGGDGAEGYIDLLQKHRTPYVTTTVSAHSAKVGTRDQGRFKEPLASKMLFFQMCLQHLAAEIRVKTVWAFVRQFFSLS